MKKLLLSFIFCSILTFAYAEDIPYKQLTPRIVEKLQVLGIKSINYYSLNLFGSDDKESLIKTRGVIDSFKSNKDNCGNFIYFWWYNWAPMSERGFIENAYMTPSEAYVCCEIGNAIHKIKKIKEQQESNKRKEIKAKEELDIYDKWMKEGVPASVAPNQNAKIKISGNKEFIQYISKLRSKELFKDTIRVKIEKDGHITCISNDENDRKILELLNIRITLPALYVFEEIDKSIPMESYVSIHLFEERDQVRTKLITGEYEASVKFNKENSKWDVKLTKDYIERFKNDTGEKYGVYLEAVSNAIISSGIKPKKYIKFCIYNSKLYIKSSLEMKGYVSDMMDLPPIAIIKSSQSGFARMNNW